MEELQQGYNIVGLSQVTVMDITFHVVAHKL